MTPTIGAALRTNLPWKRLAPIAAVLIVLGWLAFAPQGLLGKADAVGYAVCHRIDARSFHLSERQLPLCARCSGMYLGVLAGIGFQCLGGRRAGFPVKGWLAFYAALALAFAVDGLNSYLSFFTVGSILYQPQNILRLATGTGMGLAVAGFIVPAFNQTVFSGYSTAPAAGGWKRAALLLGTAAVLDAGVLSENTLLLYPLALLSAAGVLVLLGMVYAMVWTMLTRTENRYTSLREAWLPLTAGLATAVLQILLVDALRLSFTGTWAGFPG